MRLHIRSHRCLPLILFALAYLGPIGLPAQEAEQPEPARVADLQTEVSVLLVLDRLGTTAAQADELALILDEFLAQSDATEDAVSQALEAHRGLYDGLRAALIAGNAADDVLAQYRQVERDTAQLRRSAMEARQAATQRIMAVFNEEQVQALAEPERREPTVPGAGRAEAALARILGQIRQLSDQRFDETGRDWAKRLMGQEAFEEGAEERIAIILDVLGRARAMSADEWARSQADIIQELLDLGIKRAGRKRAETGGLVTISFCQLDAQGDAERKRQRRQGDAGRKGMDVIQVLRRADEAQYAQRRDQLVNAFAGRMGLEGDARQQKVDELTGLFDEIRNADETALRANMGQFRQQLAQLAGPADRRQPDGGTKADQGQRQLRTLANQLIQLAGRAATLLRDYAAARA